MFLKVIFVIFVLHILLLLVQFAIAGWIGRRNLLRLLMNMLPYVVREACKFSFFVVENGTVVLKPFDYQL